MFEDNLDVIYFPITPDDGEEVTLVVEDNNLTTGDYISYGFLIVLVIGLVIYSVLHLRKIKRQVTK